MKMSFFVVLALFLSINCFAQIPSSKTNLDVMDNGKSLYGETTTRVGKQLIGVNTSNGITIDEGAIGTTLGGAVTITGATTHTAAAGFSNTVTLAKYLVLSEAASVSPSASTGATITTTATNTLVAGFASSSSADVIATTNVAAGTIIILSTVDSSKDLVLTESGNMLLGASTRTLSDVADRICLVYDATSLKWFELFFADNN